ncbi:hypothetical protein AQJ91_15335 [Streptomyces dysideae]|uniref:Uncharacterized protein n=1 Tax=Streptomyces dysideae TaxID=909626 RepID=A0A101V0E5_9ACTN|nr:hypothetical protein AQJ91_15335 [Streptomyces dysideae]
MQLVDLAQGELVDVALDLFDGDEVPGDVEHRAAPAVARGVLDGAARDQPGAGLDGVLLDGRREELAQGLDAVEEAGGLGGGDGDARTAAVEAVPLGAVLALGQAQLDAAPAVPGDRQRVTRRRRRTSARYSATRRAARESPTRMRVASVMRYGGPPGVTEAGAGITWSKGRAFPGGGRRARGERAHRRDEQQGTEKAKCSVVLSHKRSLP